MDGVYEELVALEQAGTPIRVAVMGAGGSMGKGLALQCGITPGIRMVAAIDLDLARAGQAATLQKRPWTAASGDGEVRAALRAGETVVCDDVSDVLAAGPEYVDVLIESSSSVAAAARAVDMALRSGIDAVLMNAEVDCLLGPLLRHAATRSGAIVTSDAGDQHGVLMRMIDEVRVWGFDVVVAGNIKGYLDRRATASSVAEEARKRRLDPVMCAAYTDGTKLNIEMALVANATGLLPARRGMLGPKAGHVSEVLRLYDLPSLRRTGVVDYILGAEPGGGVFVVGHCDEPVQRDYLSYYKMGDGPYYLFHRPFHLCHLETTHALAKLALERKPVFAPLEQPVTEVVAVAKTDLAAGTEIDYGVGGEHVYGEVERRATSTDLGAVPICLLERQDEGAPRVTSAVRAGEVLTWDCVDLPDGELLDLYRRQVVMETTWARRSRKRIRARRSFGSVAE